MADGRQNSSSIETFEDLSPIEVVNGEDERDDDDEDPVVSAVVCEPVVRMKTCIPFELMPEYKTEFSEDDKNESFKINPFEMNLFKDNVLLKYNQLKAYKPYCVDKKKKDEISIPLKPIRNTYGLYHIRQPFKILTDIWGVLTSHRFRDELFQYVDVSLKNHLVKNIDTPDMRIYLEELVRRTDVDLLTHPQMPVVKLECKEDELIEAVYANIEYRRKHKDKTLMQYLDSIFNQIWNEGYANKTLRPHLFPDVIPNFKKWHLDPYFVKIYTFASGPIEIQKLFLSSTKEGNVAEWITSGFDAHHRYKYDSNKYRGVLSSLNEREAKNLFYFTDSPNKGKAARKSGMTVFIVMREGNRKYKQEDLELFPIVKSFDEFDFFEFADSGC